MSEASVPPSDQDTALRKRLLNVILRNTLRSTGIPSKWIGAETQTITSSAGDVSIELAVEVKCEEPRLFAYLAAFQAEFIRRLSAVENDPGTWFRGISWRLNNERAFATVMPSHAYWDEVDRDREITARLQGETGWDRETLAVHFRETTPGELLTDFLGKRAPQREIEDVMDRAPRRRVRGPLYGDFPTFTLRRQETDTDVY